MNQPVVNQLLKRRACRDSPVWGIPRPWFYLLLGLLLTPLWHVGFIFTYMAWFLEALIHELSHCIAAYFFGCLAFPTISLEQHAAAWHQEQIFVLALIVWGILGWVTWHFRHIKGVPIFLGCVTLLYPLLAFTQAKEFFHLISGHGGELVFAAIFFWRALIGGVYEETERPIYATIAWHLWIQNVILCASLVYSAEARNWYLNNCSFGLENDYMRIAGMLNWRLESVAALMLLFSLAIPPVGIVFWRLVEREKRKG